MKIIKFNKNIYNQLQKKIEIQEQNFEVEVTEEVAGNLEQELMTEELTIVETAPIEDLKIIEDIKNIWNGLDLTSKLLTLLFSLTILYVIIRWI